MERINMAKTLPVQKKYKQKINNNKINNNKINNNKIKKNNDFIIPNTIKKTNFKRNFWLSFLILISLLLILIPKPKMFAYSHSGKEHYIFQLPASHFNITKEYISSAYNKIHYSKKRLTLCSSSYKNVPCQVIKNAEEKNMIVSAYYFIDNYFDKNKL
jgi:hypothetical protein